MMGGIKLLRRPAPRSLSFTWIPLFTQAYAFTECKGNYDFKKERDHNQRLVETIDQGEATALVDRGYSLVGRREVEVEVHHCSSSDSPSDWSSSSVQKQLFTLSHPDASREDVDLARILIPGSRQHSYVAT